MVGDPGNIFRGRCLVRRLVVLTHGEVREVLILSFYMDPYKLLLGALKTARGSGLGLSEK